VDAGIVRVVASLQDPDDRVGGRGFAFLRERGVEVVTGVLEAEAELLNRPYLHQRRTGRPLLTLKLAMTLDGRLAAPDGSSRWITGEVSRHRVHARRSQVDAVLVGAGTVLADDPRLTARAVDAPRQPARVIVDSRGRVPGTAQVFEGSHAIVATTVAAPVEAQTAWKEAGAEVVGYGDERGGVDLASLLDDLGRRGWLEVLCEGGAELATSLLRSDLVDRLELFHGPVITGRGGPEIGGLDVATMSQVRSWDLIYVERIEDDVLTVYERRRGE
jgi:diaminohydroxyphosphoribosylaminopyrimidine deaminase/5-amino-6-(5-phosphoribosylamino)uracil reductase